MDLTRIKADFENFKRSFEATHDQAQSNGGFDGPINISVASPGPGSQVAFFNNDRNTPGSGIDENNLLSNVSRHFDSLAVDSILKAPSTNKP